MLKPIVQSKSAVTLIGGGAVETGDLAYSMARAPVLVAADGGADAALAAGYSPIAVIGDFDSISADAQTRLSSQQLFPIREQDSTDFDKALRHIAAPVVVAVGFLGNRVDHQLAAFNALVRHADRPCILLGPHEVIFHAPPHLELELGGGDIVSLFPMARLSGCSTGLEWPIDGLVLAPDGRVGTSNRALGGAVCLDIDGPGLLVIVPRRAIDKVIQAIGPTDQDQGH